MAFRRTIARTLLGGTFCAACASTATPPPVPPVTPTDRCIVGSGGADTVVIALGEAARADHAPKPANDSERLAFRQEYDTVVRIDCDGRLRPGLAESWTTDSGGSVWTFRLADRVFSGGGPITAERVLESWNRYNASLQPSLAGVSAAEARVLIVTPGSSAGVAALADPGLAVAGPPRPHGRPEASTPMRPVIEYRIASGSRLLDLLPHGVDIAVTRDPAAIAYATRLSEFAVSPLPADRTYFLVTTSGPVVDAGRDTVEQRRFRSELARDVVSEAASAAEPLPGGGMPCRSEAPPRVGPRRRILYPRGDRTARELAERIVALASVELTLEAAESDEMAATVLSGADYAYILPFPRVRPISCAGQLVLPRDAVITALVDTRAHLLLRRGAARVEVEQDGIPRILPPNSP
jgi:hypothetical protein